MSAQPTELMARLIDLFGSPATADPTKLFNNLVVNPNGTVTIGTGLILPDGYTRTLTDMGRNRVINGGMDIWQRATTVTGSLSGYQSVDRFGCTTGSGSGHNAAISTDVPNNAFAYSWKFTVGTGAAPAAGNFSGVWHNIEGYNVIDFAYGKSIAQVGTLTFWVKASIAGTYAVGFMNASLNRNYITTYNVTTANTWQQVSIVLPGDITGTWNNQSSLGLSICWDLGSGSTYQTATLNTWQAGQMYGTASSVKPISTSGATFQLTGVQFEIGAYNSPFERRLVATELNNCMRYYEQLNGGQYAVGGVQNATIAYLTMQWTVTKRAAPTITGTPASTYYFYSAGTNNVAPTSWSASSTTIRQAIIACNLASGGVAGQACLLEDNSGSAVYINSEL